MQVTIVMQPRAVETVRAILERVRLNVEPLSPATAPNLDTHYTCTVKNEDLRDWVLEMLREIDGVEAAYVKPHAELAEWKVVR